MNKTEFREKIWTNAEYLNYVNFLRTLSDEDYKNFNDKITPVTGSEIFGVRVPKLRECAKEISKGDFRAFLDCADNLSARIPLSHEEITVYGLVIGYAKHLPYGELCDRIRRYSRLVNNWACCDVPVSSLKAIREYSEEYKIEIQSFLNAENPWQQRVGVIILLDHYLSTEDNAEYALTQINRVNSGEYYVQMAQAWLIATAFAKHRGLTKRYLETDFSLGNEVLKMTVRKLRDSYRVSAADKEWAKTLL